MGFERSLKRLARLVAAAVLAGGLAACSATGAAGREPGGSDGPAAPRAATGSPSADGSPINGDWPGPANTGVPDGVQLTRKGGLKVLHSGAVIDGLDIHGPIIVQADNVTIKNTRVASPGEYWAVEQKQGFSGLTIEDSEIFGNGRDQVTNGVMNHGGMMTMRRVDVHTVSAAINTQEGLIEDCYFHDPKYFEGDHTDMIWARGGQPKHASLIIRHNTIFNTLNQTSAVALFQFDGVTHDTTVERNLLAGGGYALYAGGGKYDMATNVKIMNNVFSRRYFPKGGAWGAATQWDEGGDGNEWDGNVWEDTRQPVPAP